MEAAHRVDRRTSGVVVFAKNQESLATLDEAFRSRKIRKTYVACVEREPVPPEGTLVNMIQFDNRRNVSRALPPDAQPGQGRSSARLAYRLACRSERYFFLDVEPETGRHHQIRAQLAAAGWPIRGDLKYGARRSCASGRIMLHARGIELHHPKTGALMQWEAAFPEDEPLWRAYSPASPVPAESPTLS
jgi:23S rRNA pseudouridine1911/1915/1917 synthase